MLPAATPSSFQTYSPWRSCLGIFKRLLVLDGSNFLLVAMDNSADETGSRPGSSAFASDCEDNGLGDACELTELCFKFREKFADASSATPIATTKNTANSVARKVQLALKLLLFGEETRLLLQTQIAAVSMLMALAQH